MSGGIGFFKPAKYLASQSGIAAGYLVTWLSASPAILANWIYQKWAPEEKPQSILKLNTIDIPHLIETKQKKTFSVFKASYFGHARPIKILSESAGTIVNALVSALVYSAISIIQMGLLICASPILILLATAALLAASAYMFIGFQQKGFDQHCIDTVDRLKTFI